MINFKKQTAIFLTAVMIFGFHPSMDNVTYAREEATASDADVLVEDIDLQQAAVTEYNLNEMATFKGRTIEQVAGLYSDAKYAGTTYDNGKSATYYTTPASTTAPYEAGVLTTDTHKTMTAMTNFYRWLVGVRPLTVESANSSLLQSEALIRNFEFAHHVSAASKPEDMSDEIWNAGAECNHNILARGYTPLGAITGWMNEGYNLSGKAWDTTGHRYALISDTLSDVQFGYSGSVAIGKDAARGNGSSYEGFYAFPAPGIMPNDLVSPTGSVWGIDYNTGLSYDDVNDVTVTITNLTSGVSYTRTVADDTLHVSKGNVLMVQPEDYNTSTKRYEDSYQVVVNGLKDAAGAAQISYTIDFVDVRPYMKSYVEKVTFPYSEYGVYQTLNDTESLKKIGTTLPKTLTVTAENGCVYEVPVTGEWTLDEADSCWFNKGDTSTLPDNITDKKGVLDKVTFGYKVITESGYQYNTLRISPASPKEGDAGTMSVYRYMSNFEHSKIYRLNETETGSYASVELFDSVTADNLSTSGVTHIYNIDSFRADDSGEYISVYFNDAWTSTAYVSTSIPKLDINHTYDSMVTKEPSCAEEGVTTYTCKVCGDTYTEAIEKLKNHDYESVIIKLPALNEQGEIRYTCKVCGDTYTEYKDAIKDIADSDITLSQSVYTYTGKACCPNVTIKHGDITLTEGVDYEVSYVDNIDVGEASVVIFGKGEYAGKATMHFSIKKAEQPVKPTALNSNAKIKLSATSFNYTGKYKKPSVRSVMFNGKTLVYGTDYKVSYSNNGKNKNIGSYSVIITGKGNYTGTVKVTYKITVSKGKTYTVSGKKYKVTNAATNGKGTVSLVGTTTAKSRLTSLNVGSTVKIGGKSFKITSIGANAFKGYRKLAKVTLGGNIKSIGANAFYGCTKLKTITIKSKYLKTVGKKAVYGIYKKARIKVPSSKYKAYKKLFKASTGFKSNMKITK